MNRIAQLTLLASFVIVAAHAQVSGPLYNGLKTPANGSLCLAVSGPYITTGDVLITTDCASGSPGQMFYTNGNGPIRIGSSSSSYCVAVAPAANGGTDYHGASIFVESCADDPSTGRPVASQSFTIGANYDIISNISQAYQLCLGTPAGATSAGYAVTLQDDGAGAYAYQAWSPRPFASPAANTTVTVALNTLLNATTPLDSQGCARDRAGNRIPASIVPCGLYFAKVSGSKVAVTGGGSYNVTLGNLLFNVAVGPIVASGAGNIVASGAGNIVASGAGNIVASGAGNLMTNGGTLVLNIMCDIVASGAGNIVASGAGNIVASGAGNIVASGAGNVVYAQGVYSIVASGAGNIVSTNGSNIVASGAGNFVAADASADIAAILRVVNTSGSNLSSIGTIQLGNAANLGAVTGAGGINPGAMGGTYSLATLAPYSVSGLTPSSTSWPTGQSMYLQWQHTGTPGNNTVSFYFQPANGSLLSLPGAKGAALLTSTTIPGMVWPYTSDQPGTLIMKDDKSGQPMATVAMTLTVVHAAAPFEITSFTASPSATNTWQLGAKLPISWTYVGAIPANDVLTVYMQVAGAQYTLVSGIPINASLPYQLPAPVGVAAGTSVILSVKDATPTGRLVVRSPAIALAAAPGAPATAMAAYRIMAVTPQLPSTRIWQLGSPLTITWTYDGNLPPNDTLSILLQPAGGPLTTLASNIPVARMTAMVSAPPNLPSNQYASVTLVDTAGVNGSAPWSIALAAPTAPAPTYAPAPAPAPRAVAPPVAAAPATVTISQLTATGAPPGGTSLWVNKTPLTFTWNTSGTAPGNQFVILQMQAGGKIWSLTASVWAGYRTYQTATYDWSTILKTTQPVTLALVDGQTGKPVSNTVTATVRIP
jgi:hypothetical protein